MRNAGGQSLKGLVPLDDFFFFVNLVSRACLSKASIGAGAHTAAGFSALEDDDNPVKA